MKGRHMQDTSKRTPEEIKYAYDILEKHKWIKCTPEEYLDYVDAHIAFKEDMAIMDEQEALRTAREKSRKRGLEQGIKKGLEESRKKRIQEYRKEENRLFIQEMALKMLKNQFKIETIVEITSLTRQEIENLHTNNSSPKK